MANKDNENVKGNEEERRRDFVLRALATPLGEVIRSWRLFRGLSLRQLGERSGIGTGYLSQLENNKIARPSDRYLSQVAQALGIEKEDLLVRRMPPATELDGRMPEIGGAGGRGSRGGSQVLSPPQGPTLGQTIDGILASEGVSAEEQHRIGEVVLPLTRQLIELLKRKE